MQGPCPINYHIPTTIEWCNALNSISPLNNSGNIISCNSVWYTEATPNLFRMVLKLPLAGIRYSNAAIYNFQDTTGFYWTSSPYASSSPA